MNLSKKALEGFKTHFKRCFLNLKYQIRGNIIISKPILLEKKGNSAFFFKNNHFNIAQSIATYKPNDPDLK